MKLGAQLIGDSQAERLSVEFSQKTGGMDLVGSKLAMMPSTSAVISRKNAACRSGGPKRTLIQKSGPPPTPK
jgi:hypothetical protein